MKLIERRNGDLYYGDELCKSADAAYRRFRSDYHVELGRNAYYRLDRIGQRFERIHGYGFVFRDGNSFGEHFRPRGRTKCYILGLVGLSYVRTIGAWDYSDISDNEFEDWLDWVFSRHSGALIMVGNRDKVGRTSKRLKVRYR